MNRLHTAIVSCLLALSFSLVAAAAEKPTISVYNSEGKGQVLMGLSDNGQWGLMFAAQENTESTKLINLQTKQVINLQTEQEIKAVGRATVADVSDDGNIVVGSYKGYPAFLDRAKGEWAILPSGKLAGTCNAVTPDGRFAVGTVNDGDVSTEEVVWYTTERPVLWDLETATEVEVPFNVIPDQNPLGETISYMRYIAVSPDGRYLLARALTYAEYFSILIDREEQTSKFIGFERGADGQYSPQLENLFFNEPSGMSPDGKWVVCNGYFVEPVSSEYSNEYIAPVRYNVETGELLAYNQKVEDQGIASYCIDNRGNVYAGSPAGSPVREFLVRYGDYWYPLRSILYSHYDIDFAFATGLNYTGTPMAVSSDGRTFVCMSDPQFGENYCLQTDESLLDVCAGINLLGIYMITPASGSVMSKMNTFTLTFDREVELLGAQNSATFGSWTSTSTNGIVVDKDNARTVKITFRPRTLEAGKQYTLTIPAGTFCVKGDKDKTNDEITAVYSGRADNPVKPTSIYPADGSVLTKLDNNSSPIILKYPYIIKVADTATAVLYANDTRVCNLMVWSTDNEVNIFPANTQYLYKGVEYRVVIAPGSITDVSGAGANEEMTISYVGNYEREVVADIATIFSDDFNNISQSLATWLLYDNDGLTPDEEMASWEFDAENTPWNFSIRDDMESKDYAAASHSLYMPAGRSDDWMLTPQLYIPEGSATLTFDAQNMSFTARDVLKIVVWESNDVLKFITDEDFLRIKAEGKTVFEEQLNPGRDEQQLAGDWTNYTVDLSDFAGKAIYIAFVNQNYGQSVVFVDNVSVMREMSYLLSLSNKQSVINQESIVIAGKLTCNNEGGISRPRFTLLDAEGNIVDSQPDFMTADDYISTDDILMKGDVEEFSFDVPLPLAVGKVNKFSIRIEFFDCGSEKNVCDEINSSVKNLTFQPTKRVVLEEMTGVTCGNCPQGIVAIDKIKEMYGDRFIPISIHTYDGDPMGSGLSYYSSELGLNAAPTGVVNRSSDVLLPMITDPTTFELTLSYYGSLWLDAVNEQLGQDTDIDVEAEVEYDDLSDTFSVPVTIKSALDADNVNYNIFLVLMEDGIVANQLNYFSSSTDALLGDWGQGGIYGKPTATNVTHNDVVRTFYSPTIYGTSGLLPQSLEAGEPCRVENIEGLKLPATVENRDNAKIAVLIIDANTDHVVNACVAKFGEGMGIEAITGDNHPADGTVYNLAGQKVGAEYKGIVIINGRKILRR